MNSRFTDNPAMAKAISNNDTFSAIAQEASFEREAQKMRQDYTYALSGSLAGNQTLPFNLVIEQGSDFKSIQLTGSAYSYDDTNATIFPVPGNTDWAMRGLSLRITDTGAGRELTSGDIPFELLMTPGYGLNFMQPFPFRYFFARNSLIRFVITNRETNTSRYHYFEIALNGYKIFTPTVAQQ